MRNKLARHFCDFRLARDQCSLGHAKKQPMLDDSDNLPDLRCQLMRIIDLSTVAIENQIPFVCDEVVTS